MNRGFQHLQPFTSRPLINRHNMEDNEHNELFLPLTESLQVPKWELESAPEVHAHRALFVQLLRDKSIFKFLSIVSVFFKRCPWIAT